MTTPRTRPGGDPAHRLQLELSRLHRHRPFLVTAEAGALAVLERSRSAADTARVLDEDTHRLVMAGTRSHWATLLCYLDNARNTTLTSEQLFIHRATLHYRLERVREIIGRTALDNGWRATALHAALRLHAGLHG